jgi:hypothetical protein
VFGDGAMGYAYRSFPPCIALPKPQQASIGTNNEPSKKTRCFKFHIIHFLFASHLTHHDAISAVVTSGTKAKIDNQTLVSPLRLLKNEQ